MYDDFGLIPIVFCSLCSLPSFFIVKNMKKNKFNYVVIFLISFFTPAAATFFTIYLYDIYIQGPFATMWSILQSSILEVVYYTKHYAKKETEEPEKQTYFEQTPEQKTPEPVAPSTNEPIQSSSVDVSHNTEEKTYHSRYYSPHSQFSNEAMYSNNKTSSEYPIISDELVESYKKGYPKKAKSYIDEWDEKYSNKALAQQNPPQKTLDLQKVKVRPVKKK